MVTQTLLEKSEGDLFGYVSTTYVVVFSIVFNI